MSAFESSGTAASATVCQTSEPIHRRYVVRNVLVHVACLFGGCRVGPAVMCHKAVGNGVEAMHASTESETMRMLRELGTKPYSSALRRLAWLSASAVCSVTLTLPTFAVGQDVPPDSTAQPPGGGGVLAPPPVGPAPAPSGPVVPAPPPDDDYAAPPTSRLAPTQADYATAAGNVPYGTTPREFHFDEEAYRPRTELSFMLGVPVWFTGEHAVVDPGVSFEMRFARRYGLIAPELTLGWQINWLDQGELPASVRRSQDLTIDSFYVSAGARIYVLRDAIVTPFISGAFDIAFWHFTGDTTTVCDYYYCSDVADYDVGIGLSGRAGVAFLPNTMLQLELGARVAMAFPVGPFDRTQGWVTPYFGVMGRF